MIHLSNDDMVGFIRYGKSYYWRAFSNLPFRVWRELIDDVPEVLFNSMRTYKGVVEDFKWYFRHSLRLNALSYYAGNNNIRVTGIRFAPKESSFFLFDSMDDLSLREVWGRRLAEHQFGYVYPKLHDFVSSLPELHRRLILLVYFQDCAIADAAVKVAKEGLCDGVMTKRTVSRKLLQAKRMLRSMIEAHDEAMPVKEYRIERIVHA